MGFNSAINGLTEQFLVEIFIIKFHLNPLSWKINIQSD